MEIDYHRELLEQLEWHWQNQLRPRLGGLTDAEYFWEPVDDCWSIRPREDLPAGVRRPDASHELAGNRR